SRRRPAGTAGRRTFSSPIPPSPPRGRGPLPGRRGAPGPERQFPFSSRVPPWTECRQSTGASDVPARTGLRRRKTPRRPGRRPSGSGRRCPIPVRGREERHALIGGGGAGRIAPPMSRDPGDPIRRVAVIGAGTMGGGIAHVAALAGYEVALADVTEALAAAGLGRIRANLDAGVSKGKVAAEDRDRALAPISPTGDLATAARAADLVVEAAPEDLEMKRGIFRRLSEACREDAILATNTSSLSVTRIAEATARPGRVIGLHFFNPPYI